MTMTLTNVSGRMKVFVLPHESYCKARGSCACIVLPGRAARRVASSLTLAAHASAEALDEAVLAVPDVAQAVRAGELRAVKAR